MCVEEELHLELIREIKREGVREPESTEACFLQLAIIQVEVAAVAWSCLHEIRDQRVALRASPCPF